MGVIAKTVRFFGWTLFIVSLIFFASMIAMFFSVDGSDRWSAIVVGIFFALLAFLGWKIKKFKKAETAVKTTPAVQNRWEKASGAHEDVKGQDAPVDHPIQATKKESIQDMVWAALDIRREVQAGRRTVEIPRKQYDPYAPLLELCSEIGNDTENNYIPFDTPISVEIEYCDRDGEITNREIDIRYIAESDYGDGYYIKAFCHLRNENRTFNIERIQQTWVNGNSVDIVQHLVNTYRNTDKYKQTILETKTRELLNSHDTIGYAAKILTYIARIDGIFTRKEKVTIANFIKELDNNEHDIEIENYVAGLVELNPSTIEYKNIIKTADISEALIKKAKEITGKDPLRQGAFEILSKRYEKSKLNKP